MSEGLTITERDGKVDLSDIVFTVKGEDLTAQQLFDAFKKVRDSKQAWQERWGKAFNEIVRMRGVLEEIYDAPIGAHETSLDYIVRLKQIAKDGTNYARF